MILGVILGVTDLVGVSVLVGVTLGVGSGEAPAFQESVVRLKYNQPSDPKDRPGVHS